MREWLSIELVLATLLVTSFTCVGLLAVWAATSRSHWFVRAAVVLVVLAPFLLIPAHEMFLGALLAIGVVGFATAVRPCFPQTRTDLRSSLRSVGNSLPRRFSLASTLLVTSVLAVLVAIVARTPTKTWQSWWMWSQCGLSFGVPIVSASLACDRNSPLWRRFVYALAMLPFLFGGFVVFGATFVAFVDVWSTTSSTMNFARISFWFAVALIAVVLLLLGLSLMNRAISFATPYKLPNSQVATIRKHPLKSRMLFAGFLLLVAAPSLYVVWELLHPLPILADPIPFPNGHDRIVELGKRLENSAVVSEYMADPIDYGKLAKAVAMQSAHYTEIVEVLSLPGWIPVQYDEGLKFADMGQITARRQIQKALSARFEIAVRKGDIEESTATYADMLRLADALHRGGLAIDFLVATACEETAHDQLFRSISKMDASGCTVTIKELESYDARRRGIDDVLYRERVWVQRAHGWIGHLSEVLQRIAPNSDPVWNVYSGVSDAHRREQAICRLLTVELALRVYHLENGKYPTTLDLLVPFYIEHLPTDPFDSEQRPPVFAPTGDGYRLYSVGPDGRDDGGQEAARPQLPFGTDHKTGDLRLSLYFSD